MRVPMFYKIDEIYLHLHINVFVSRCAADTSPMIDEKIDRWMYLKRWFIKFGERRLSNNEYGNMGLVFTIESIYDS